MVTKKKCPISLEIIHWRFASVYDDVLYIDVGVIVSTREGLPATKNIYIYIYIFRIGDIYWVYTTYYAVKITINSDH